MLDSHFFADFGQKIIYFYVKFLCTMGILVLKFEGGKGDSKYSTVFEPPKCPYPKKLKSKTPEGVLVISLQIYFILYTAIEI